MWSDGERLERRLRIQNRIKRFFSEDGRDDGEMWARVLKSKEVDGALRQVIKDTTVGLGV